MASAATHNPLQASFFLLIFFIVMFLIFVYISLGPESNTEWDVGTGFYFSIFIHIYTARGVDMNATDAKQSAKTIATRLPLSRRHGVRLVSQPSGKYLKDF